MLCSPPPPSLHRYASSVGSKALTIRQACFLALIFEFLGAVTAGSAVSNTIRKGIADIKCFEDNSMDAPLLMYGNMCAVMIVGIWLLLATYLEMPVSTTHSCVGAMVGMAIAIKGSDCVVWHKESEADRLYIPQGVVGIVISWFVSPILSGLIAIALYWAVRKFILRSENAFKRSIIFYPILVFGAVWVNAFFIVSKGMNKKICPYDKAAGTGDNWLCNSATEKKDGKVDGLAAMGFTFGIGVVVSLLCYPLYARIQKWVDNDFANGTPWYAVSQYRTGRTKATDKVDAKKAAASPAEVIQMDGATDELGQRSESYTAAAGQGSGTALTNAAYLEVSSTGEKPTEPERKQSFAQRMVAKALHSSSIDVHASMVGNEEVAAIHDNAEVFDDKAEAVFRYIQIFTAICDSFAHGANDVANAMGPFMAIYFIYKNGKISKNSDTDDEGYWILALGGVGIGFGLLLYGYKIIRAIGVKLSKITPSRGFAIELGAACVIILGSYYGLPLSTTHCQVGATTGVALLEGTKGVNKKTLMITAFGWVATLLAAGLGAGLLTANGIYAPLAPTLQQDLMGRECAGYDAGQYSWLNLNATSNALMCNVTAV